MIKSALRNNFHAVVALQLFMYVLLKISIKAKNNMWHQAILHSADDICRFVNTFFATNRNFSNFQIQLNEFLNPSSIYRVESNLKQDNRLLLVSSSLPKNPQQ